MLFLQYFYAGKGSVTGEEDAFEAPPKLQDRIILVTKYPRTQKLVENKSALH